MRHLELKRRVWWMDIGIPADVRHAFDGQKRRRTNLQTGDLRTAMERRDQTEREFLALFKDIRRGVVKAAAEEVAELRGALWREAIANPKEHDRDFIVGLAQDEAERLRARQSTTQAAKAFERGLSGQHPVDHFLEQFLTEAQLAAKTANERRGLVRQFAQWAKAEELGMLEIDRKAAGRYVQEKIAPRDRSTGKKHLTAVKTYWDYLKRRGHVQFEVSPWHDQLEPQRGRKGTKEVGERPFTTEEVKALLYGTPTTATKFDELTREVVRFGLLSGMREDEIVSLRVDNVIEGPDDMGSAFDIAASKTDAGVRMVPVHPDLMDSVTERMKGKKPNALLFDEFDDVDRPADTFGKRFNRYRKARGVDDKRVGKRRSLVNFHSTRRWFVSEAERAGHPEATVAVIVGHAEKRAKGFTFSTYNRGGPSGAQRRAVVESVVLPK
ncbi:tyrosine-type recombinase/integrase [Mesorhizobium sp. ORM16]|uniref:tyrosine-type recombinase/integrase n=1 Tax=Mesorhizobium sp. ORM16 TaxID=3376989 RepID=UPI0038574B12